MATFGFGTRKSIFSTTFKANSKITPSKNRVLWALMGVIQDLKRSTKNI